MPAVPFAVAQPKVTAIFNSLKALEALGLTGTAATCIADLHSKLNIGINALVMYVGPDGDNNPATKGSLMGPDSGGDDKE